MFSVEFLHVLRKAEIDSIADLLPPRGRILELGGGTGYQAAALAALGFDVVAIDLPRSTYSEKRVLPVIEYDGQNIPFANHVFDAVFSSSVLEHVADLDAIHRESKRILRPGARCVHVMPSAAWRFWTYVAGFAEALRDAVRLIPQVVPRRPRRPELRRAAGALRELMATGRSALFPPPHGEHGSAFGELRTFSRRHWTRHFSRSGYKVLSARPMGLFYTGHMALGPRLSLSTRRRAARWLGSACIAYVVEPAA